MTVRNPEDTFDVFRGPYADLNMGLAPEACGGIDRFVFGKYSPDCVKGISPGDFARLVQIIDDHAVEVAVEKIFTT